MYLSRGRVQNFELGGRGVKKIDGVRESSIKYSFIKRQVYDLIYMYSTD